MRSIGMIALFTGMLIAGQAMAQGQESKEDSTGRWIVVPASTSPVMSGNTPFFFAWRIDKFTGAIEMCTYDPGGWKTVGTPGSLAPERLTCSLPTISPQ